MGRTSLRMGLTIWGRTSWSTGGPTWKMKRSFSAVMGVAAMLTACDSLQPVACTAIFVYGISVEVVDASSGTGLADGATLTLRSGDYVESATETFNAATLVGAGERPGTYDLTVAHEGYHTWIRTGVVVTADECHVRPVALRAELEAIS